MKSYEVTLWIMNNAIDDFGPEVATAYVDPSDRKCTLDGYLKLSLEEGQELHSMETCGLNGVYLRLVLVSDEPVEREELKLPGVIR